jgi:hypothetical protein
MASPECSTSARLRAVLGGRYQFGIENDPNLATEEIE